MEHFSQQVTIEILCEDILLNVFHHFLASTPRIWPILGWVCRKWRQIIFASPLGLSLRLYCTHRTPVLKSIDCWPALPVILEYGGALNLDTPVPEDDDNIIAALKQSGRVSSISLTVTSSLLKKLSAISAPLSGLEELVLLSKDNVQQTFPSTFLWGPHLRTLHSTGIAFPSLPPLLLPCQDLVDLQLHEIPSSGYFSPEEFTNALSGTPQLRSLTLHILSFPRRRSLPGLPPPPGEHIILPALTNLKYRGTSKYLDNLVARIDATHLKDIDITLFSQPTMDASQIGRFIERLEMQMSLSKAEVKTSAHAISISITDSVTSTPLQLQISCTQLDWQLSCMAQICDQFSPFLFRVHNVEINTTEPPSGHDDVAGEQWLELLHSFGGARTISVPDELALVILCALRHNGDTSALPSLRRLRVQKPMVMDGQSWDCVQSFITSRWISGRPVKVNAPSYRCHICHSSSKEKLAVKHHLRHKHGYKIFCSYCGEFECTPGKTDLFQEHLGNKHPEIAHNDGLISKPSLSNIQLENLVDQHGSLRPQDVVPPMSEPEDRVLGT